MIDARDMARLVARAGRLNDCVIVHRFEGIRQASGEGEYLATVEIRERVDPRKGVWYGVEISDADGHSFVGNGANTVDAAMMTAPWSLLDGAALGHAQGDVDSGPGRPAVTVRTAGRPPDTRPSAASDLSAPNTMPTEEEGGES